MEALLKAQAKSTAAPAAASKKQDGKGKQKQQDAAPVATVPPKSAAPPAAPNVSSSTPKSPATAPSKAEKDPKPGNDSADGWTTVTHKKSKKAIKNTVSIKASAAYVAKVKDKLSKTETPLKMKVVASKDEIHNIFKERSSAVPVSFKKIFIQMSFSYAGKQADYRTRVRWVRSWLLDLDILNKVRDFSMIGKSVLELYVAEPAYSQVAQALHINQAKILKDFDPMAQDKKGVAAMGRKDQIINRLVFLYKRQSLLKMKEAVLEGYPLTIQEAIVAKCTKATPMAVDKLSTSDTNTTSAQTSHP